MAETLPNIWCPVCGAMLEDENCSAACMAETDYSTRIIASGMIVHNDTFVGQRASIFDAAQNKTHFYAILNDGMVTRMFDTPSELLAWLKIYWANQVADIPEVQPTTE